MTGTSPPRTALVLAGSRVAQDPVARSAGVAHKALAPIAGVPMLARVIETLRRSPEIGRLALSADAALIDRLDSRSASVIADAGVQLLPTGERPSDSVRIALRTLPAPYPLFVTTADHPLLTPAMVRHFCAAAPADADLVVGVARASLIRRSYPAAVRTYFRLGREGYSGCNLYLFATPAAERVATFWAALEGLRKRPWRIVAALGWGALLRFAFGRATLASALAALSRRVGARIAAVEMPFAEAAIDVDKPADLELAESILAGRL